MPRRSDPIWRTCQQCGKAFKAMRNDAITCSVRCRSRRYRGEEPATPKVKKRAVA